MASMAVCCEQPVMVFFSRHTMISVRQISTTQSCRNLVGAGRKWRCAMVHVALMRVKVVSTKLPTHSRWDHAVQCTNSKCKHISMHWYAVESTLKSLKNVRLV